MSKKAIKKSTSRMPSARGITPIEIFKHAHARSKVFISGGKGNKGRRDADDLRAAVVFAVASVDAFFRAKIIYVLRAKKLSKNNFLLPDSARKVVQKVISKKLFAGKEYAQLNPEQKKAISAMWESGKTYLISYLQQALTEMSFQNINQLDEGMKMMGERPQEIWGKINLNVGSSTLQKRAGRPKKKARGPKTDIKIQLRNLFLRRHKIVHEADLSLQSRKHRGKERKISYDTVKKWIDSTEKVVKKMDSEVSEA